MKKPRLNTYWLMYSHRWSLLPVLDIAVERQYGRPWLNIEIRWLNRWSCIEIML